MNIILTLSLSVLIIEGIVIIFSFFTNKKNIRIEHPFVILLVGTPLSGKTTWCKYNYVGTKIISRDNIIMENSNGNNYNDTFNNTDQKQIDKLLNKKLIESATKKENVIIDMTNLTKSRRRKNLQYFNDYYKIAVVFPVLSEDEYERRNNKRFNEENKTISLKIIKDMLGQYEPITKEENFNKIININ